MEYPDTTQRFDIFDIYRRFCDIKSGNAHLYQEAGNKLNDDSEKAKFSREAMVQLTKIVDSSFNMRISRLDELRKLMCYPNIMGDFSEFTNFYEFVFFMCREHCQKNITVSKAIEAWKLVLAGRFRLLTPWCAFVEENQRYNISEDTWRQVLAFSRCVHEDLSGYDPEGAWPSLIDDFVEHMYRIQGSNDCSSRSSARRSVDADGESSIFEEPLPGLKELPGLKRRYREDFRENDFAAHSPSDGVDRIASSKRRRQQQLNNFVQGWDNFSANSSGEELQSVNSPLHSSKSPCAVEGGLSEGFAALFSSPRVQN